MNAAPDVFGLDLGGTTLKSGWVDPEGAVTRFAEHGWRGRDPLAVLRDVAGQAGLPPHAPAGLACAGVISPDGVLVERTPHLPIAAPAPLATWLAEWIGHPVHALNDADAAALAEHTFGAARGTRASITIAVGSGVGCGVMLDGRLWSGPGGGAGELGHVPLHPSGGHCACGVPGCAEPHIGGEGLVVMARARGVCSDSAEALFALAAEGNGQARAVIEHAAWELGRLAAFAVQLIAPEVVVFGGKLMTRAGETHLERVRASLLFHLPPTRTRALEVRLARLGERAGVVGAAIWARARR